MFLISITINSGFINANYFRKNKKTAYHLRLFTISDCLPSETATI